MKYSANHFNDLTVTSPVLQARPYYNNCDKTKRPEWKEVPTTCPNCNGSSVKFAFNSMIYSRLYGPWPFCYICTDCWSYVGCHPNSIYPLGTLADKPTQKARRYVHHLIDFMWKAKYIHRSDSYLLLAKFLQMPPADCHVGNFNKEQAEAIWTNREEFIKFVIESLKSREVRIKSNKHKHHEVADMLRTSYYSVIHNFRIK